MRKTPCSTEPHLRKLNMALSHRPKLASKSDPDDSWPKIDTEPEKNKERRVSKFRHFDSKQKKLARTASKKVTCWILLSQPRQVARFKLILPLEFLKRIN